MKAFTYIIIAGLITCTSACKKFVEVDDPRTELASGTVFINDKTATAAMVGIYSDMNGFNYQYANIVTMFMGGMNADEFTYALSSTAEWEEFKNNRVLPSNRFVNALWAEPYQYNYRATAVIEGVTASTTLSPAVKNQLLGEAKFLRAFLYFYLVNTFGDVPLILNTDVQTNTNLPRTPKEQVYQAIIADLTEAKSLLSVNYPESGRTRPTKGAATLLLARTYLYTGNYAQAEIEASEVISNGNYELLQGNDMNKTFLANSREAIWQLQAVNTGGSRNTWEGFTMTPASMTAPVAYYRLTKGTGGLVEAFEPGDLRKANWTGVYTTTATPPLTHTYPYKYKVRTNPAGVTEYSMVLRFAEAYLIRGEARIQQNKLALGMEDLDVIHKRANPTAAALPVPATIAAAMLTVEQERRVELFTEWGHRWYDLKRWKSVTGENGKTRADDILQPLKAAWKSTAILMPIPADAMRTNGQLVQNEGYSQITTP